MSTTLGWRMRADARASRMKRAVARGSAANFGRNHLSATACPHTVCVALNTAPIPPWPIACSTRYLPATMLPGSGRPAPSFTLVGYRSPMSTPKEGQNSILNAKAPEDAKRRQRKFLIPQFGVSGALAFRLFLFSDLDAERFAPAV